MIMAIKVLINDDRADSATVSRTGRSRWTIVLISAIFLLVAKQLTGFKNIYIPILSFSADQFEWMYDMPATTKQQIQPQVTINADSYLSSCSSSSRNTTTCCVTWDIDGDDWWLHHPDWEISLENHTHYCFSIIKDIQKATFMRNLHHLQWSTNNTIDGVLNCSNIEKSVEVNSGFGASTGWLQKAFWHAYKKSNKPFQIVHNTRRWLYSTSNTSSWAYCESEDTRCYYLPVSPCPRNQTDPREHRELRPPRNDVQLQLQYYWMKQYLFRQRQVLRKQLYDFTETYFKVSLPCTTMHVRRGDAGLPQPPFRRYAAVQEYIDAAHIQPGERIVLLTDDQTTIDKIKKYHPQYHWIYLDRPRVSNIQGGFDGHIPSGDEAYELLVIHAELSVASKCEKIVHGQSGFVQGLLNDMHLDKKNFTSYYVNTAVSKEEARKFKNKQERVQSLLQDLENNHKQIKRNITR